MLVEEDVLRLEVPVQHALRVDRVHSARNVTRNAEGLLGRERATLLDHREQALAVYVFQNQTRAGVDPNVQHTHDAGVRTEPLKRLAFAKKAIEKPGRRELGHQELDDHPARVRVAGGEIDLAHGAGPEQALQTAPSDR